MKTDTSISAKIEASYETFIEFCDLIAMPIFLIDVAQEEPTRFRFRKLNQYYEDAIGLKSDAIAGLFPEDFLPAEIATKVNANYMHCVKTMRNYRYEEELELPTGRFWWETCLSPIMDGATVVAIVGIATNITKFKIVEQRFVQATRELNRMNKDLEIVSATTAHDLRGPLRQLKLINGMVAEGFQNLGDGKGELLEVGQQVVDKALLQIDTVIENTAIRRDRRRLVEVELDTYCRDLFTLYDPLSLLNTTCHKTTISCERIVLDICLRNLVDNAVKYARSGVSVSVHEQGEDIVICVQDDGPGFGEGTKDLREIANANASDTTSGIGLISAIELLEARGGELYVSENCQRKGTVVCIRTLGRLVSSQ